MGFRCSALPINFKCPGSAYPVEGEVLVTPHNEFAELGTAVHEALATLVVTREIPDLAPLALKYSVDKDDLGMLTAFGAQAWRAIGASFPNPIVEQDGHDEVLDLTGHIDVLSFTPTVAAIIDWKGGYKQSDHYAQVMGYARLIFANNTEVQTVRCSVVWLRDHSVDTITVTREDSDRWQESFEHEILMWDGVFHPGEHCLYCPRSSSCPARQALVRSAVAEIGEEGLTAQLATGDLTGLMPHIVALYKTGKIALAKQIIDRIDKLIREHIALNGPVDMGDGTEMALVPESRDTITPLLAWPVLQNYLDENELAGVVTIGKTKLLDAVSAKAPKGNKGKIKTEVMADLAAAGAVEKSEILKLKTRKIEKEIAQ